MGGTRPSFLFFFFFNDTATTEIYTLSLHDALPISARFTRIPRRLSACWVPVPVPRSEEHTSELQSHVNLVCRLLLEKQKILLSSGTLFPYINMYSPATLNAKYA